MNDFDILLQIIREQRDILPLGKRTMGESIHALVLEVLGQCVQDAIKKITLSKGGQS